MRLRWQLVLGCLCVLATAAHCGVVPTQDTIVVARSDEATTIADTSQTEVTSEEPSLPIKLTEMEVQSEVTMRYAHTAVVTHIRNPAKKAQEATFRVLLPETAFISGFTMILDGKPYKAYVKEKEEAKQIYNQAVSQGIGAAHVAAKARDSNHFTVSVNVEPNTNAVFNLTYEELLVRRNGVYNQAINLHPGALVPKLTVTVHIKEVQKITELRVPEVRTGNEIDATADDASNSKAMIEKSNNDREVTVVFKPDLDEQQRLMEIYAAKTKESLSHTNRYYNSGNDDSKTEGVLGQFVVQYDVERPKHGEILVNDGYFVHFYAPTSLPPLNKHVVFVLDTSGSMMDRKIVQLREAMKTILAELNKGDYFNIVEFASSVKVHELKEADEPAPESRFSYYYEDFSNFKLVPPSQATPENVEKAQKIVSRLNAAGGTNIASALNVAIDLVQKGIGWTQPAPTTTSTTSAPGNETEKETQPAIKTEDNKTETKDVATKLEPIIIFLTDGDPTVGETNPRTIINHLTEKNYGENKASIFSLAFGEDADRNFLRKLSLRNDGFMRHIYEAADAALQLHDFYRQVSSPLLADVVFTYPPEQVKEGSLTKWKFRTIYAGSEAVVAGRVADDAGEITPLLHGFCGVEDGHGRVPYEIRPKVPVVRERQDYLPLERLWAYLTIKQLLDERDAADDKPDEKDTPEKKALALALKYEFVTPLTSLVVVKPNDTKAVDAESVDKSPVPVPSYNYAPAAAFGGGAVSHPSYPIFASQVLPASINSQSYPLVLDSAPLYEVAAEEALVDYDESGFVAYRGMSGPPGALNFYSSNRASVQSLVGFPGVAGYSSVQSNYRNSGSVAYVMPRLPDPSSTSYYYSKQHSVQPDISNFSPGEPASSYGGHTSFGLHSDITTPLLPPPATSLAPPSSLEVYHLQEYGWVEPLIDVNSDALVLDVNGTKVNLTLTKDAAAPKSSNGDVDCANAVDGAAGVCVYLTRCSAARDISAQLYTTTHCKVDNNYAGICCPKAKVDEASTTP